MMNCCTILHLITVGLIRLSSVLRFVVTCDLFLAVITVMILNEAGLMFQTINPALITYIILC